MEKTINRQQMQTILDQAPQGVDKKTLIDKFVSNGFTVEGVNDKKEPNLAQTIGGALIKGPADLIGTGFAGLGALGQKIGETGTKYVAGKLDQLINATGGFDGEQTFSQRVAGQQPSTIGQAYQNQSQQVQQSGANAIMQPITGEKVRPAQNLEQLAGDVIQTGALAIPGATLGKGAGLAAKTGYGALYGAGTGALTGAGMAMSDNASTEQIAQQTLMGGATGGLIGGALPLAIAGTQKAIKFAKDPIGYGSSIKQDIQSYAGSKSVQPQFGSSVERLTTSPTRTETPLATYNRYLPQAEKSLTDIKVDAPISDIGSKIGDAFRKVVDLRRTAGSIMGQELKTVGKTKVNIEPIFMDFETALKDSGLTYNGITKKIMASDLSKVAPDDIAIIEDFVQELNKAGTNPSVAKIDAILSRVSDKINYAKSAKGITQTTNGERIVKGVLAKLRNSFENVPGLEKYNQARANYAELSDFIDEGSGFLGKTTQSGDFAKDASLAKSAVQSILNNGKKDWLLKLEGLTDYPALDEATLALQAMKDAGDYRGLSLLQTLSEGQIPTSKAGFTQKLIDYGIEKGTNVVAGSPAQRTRAYLKSLENTFSKEAPNTITKNSAIPAKGLMKIPTNKGIKTSNVDISKSIPQSTKAASKVVEKSIPKELQPLAEEARKYKSAEAFINAQEGKYYHGGEKIDEYKNIGEGGVYLTPDLEMADIHKKFINWKTKGERQGVINEGFVKPKKTLILNENQVDIIEAPYFYKKQITKIKKDGYDSIMSHDGKQLFVFDATQVKTKSQLKKIWKEANN